MALGPSLAIPVAVAMRCPRRSQATILAIARKLLSRDGPR
jgi:hypothetical protein